MALVSVGNLYSDGRVDRAHSVGRSIEPESPRHPGNFNRRRIESVERRTAYRDLFYTECNDRELHSWRRDNDYGARYEGISVR